MSSSNQGSFYTYKWGESVTSDALRYDNQVGDIFLPSQFTALTPVIVLVHGGYWYDQYRRKTTNGSSMEPLALDLQSRGYVAVNLEYRRAANYPTTGDSGGYTETFDDLIDGIDALQWVATECGFDPYVDLNRIVVVGHSAGGHLALWRALQFGVDLSGPPAQYLHPATLNPIAAVGLAAVSDFGDCGTVSCSAIDNFMSYGTYGQSSTDVQAHLEVWSLLQMLPRANSEAVSPIKVKLVHCSSDTIVYPAQSSAFEAESSSLSMIDTTYDPCSGGHFDVIDPSHFSWTDQVIPFLDSLCSIDADCDDGLFCNGLETCVGGVCQPATDPCPGQLCDEEGDRCFSIDCTTSVTLVTILRATILR